MCGIAGVVSRDSLSRPDPGLVECMVERLHHRGPDDTGIMTLPGVSLGLKRLSIIDVVGGRQPIQNEDGTIAFVGNGEIYNFRVLRQELESKGHVFRTGSDMEVIVHGYEAWGDEITTRLSGQFAFALWDGKRKRLFAARDRAGEKPLYYSDIGKDIIFASEIKSLLARSDVPRTLDPVALDCFLSYEFVVAPRTMFSAVKKLPAAHAMVVENGVVRIWPYWTVPEESDSNRSDEEWIEELRETLSCAVESQMMSDVPLGAFLSGGLDSSAIVAFMARASNRPVKTFSIAFSEGSYDESTYARTVSGLFGTDHREQVVDPGIVSLFDKLVLHLDEPFADVSLFPTYLISKLASQDVKVVLSGDGGDELFAGYDWYVAERFAKQLSCFPGNRALTVLHALSEWFPPSAKKKGFVNKVKRFLSGAVAVPNFEHYRWLTHLTPNGKDKLYTNDLKSLISESDTNLSAMAKLDERCDDSLNRQLYADFKLFLSDDILVKVDRMSMATSLEARSPFLDKDVVELAFRMPGHMKLRGNTRKYVLKKAMKGILPGHILNRPKEGFSIPIKNWLRRELRPLMDALLTQERVEQGGVFQWSEVERLKSEHIAGQANHAHQLFPLMVFERWSEEFLR